MAQRKRKQSPVPNPVPPPPFMVGQVPIDAQELAPGVIDDASKVVPGVLTSVLANPLDTPAAPSPGTFVANTGVTSDGHAYLQLSWGAVSGATEYEVRWKQHTDTVYSYARTTGPAYQINGLLPNVLYDWNIASVNAFGNTSGYVAADSTSTTAADTTAPATPASVTANAGVRAVIVAFTANTEVDLDHYVIEIYSDAGLTVLVKTFTGLATVWAYNGTASTQYWARVKAVDTSGNSSAWSATVTATTGTIANSDIQAGTITADRLVAGTITAASGIIANAAIGGLQVQDASISDAKIVELSADKITGGVIDAGVLLSGNIRTGDTGQRVVMDASGIKLYNSAGLVTVNLDASLGSGFFSGTISASTFTSDDGSIAVQVRGAEGGANGGEIVWAASAGPFTQGNSLGFISLKHVSTGTVDTLELHVGKVTSTDAYIVIQGSTDPSIQSVQLVVGAQTYYFDPAGLLTGLSRSPNYFQGSTQACTGNGTPTLSQGTTFPTAFAVAPKGVSGTLNLTTLLLSQSGSPSTTGTTFGVRNVDNANWSSAQTIRYVVGGHD